MKILGRDIGLPPTTDETHARDYMERTRMSFGDHLEELRLRLILGLLGVAVGTVIGLFAATFIMNVIFQPLYAVQEHHGLPIQLLGSTPQAGFGVYMKVGILSGVLLAGPWLLVQVWLFVASGLYPKEQRFVSRFLPASALLFISGVLFMYFIALPIVLNFFVAFNKSFAASYNGMTSFQRLLLGADEPTPAPDRDHDPSGEAASPADRPALTIPMLDEDPRSPAPGSLWFNRTTRMINLQGVNEHWSVPLTPGRPRAMITADFTVDSYTSFVLTTALAFGLAFQLPLCVLFLAWTGIVSVQQMRSSRKVIILGIVIAAAVLTPPDVFSQTLLAIPMLGLFEAGLFAASRFSRAKSSD